MSCPCGSDTASRTSERTSIMACLEYVECRKCGRIGRESLLLQGETVLMGNPAREAFRDITKESAEALWQHHQEEQRREREERNKAEEAVKGVDSEQMALFT